MYIKRVAQSYDINKHVSLHSQVLSQIWLENLNKWKVTVRNKKTEEISEHLFDIV